MATRTSYPMRCVKAFIRFTLFASTLIGFFAGCTPTRFEGGRSSIDREVLREIVVGNETRSYLFHRPTDIAKSAHPPLLILLHGTHGNASGIAAQTGMNQAADRRHFIAVYPNGTGFLRFLTWNTGRCCGSAMAARADDIGFLRAIIREQIRTEHIDTTRVYIAGFSDGGMMAFRAGCEMGPEIAAIGVVAGRMPDTLCVAKRPLPVIAFGGTDDQDLAGDHDRYTTPTSFSYAFSLDTSMSFWARHNGCDVNSKRRKIGANEIISFRPCRQQSPVELYHVAGGHHEWPGGATFTKAVGDTNTLLATRLIVDFLLRHRVRNSVIPRG